MKSKWASDSDTERPRKKDKPSKSANISVHKKQAQLSIKQPPMPPVQHSIITENNPVFIQRPISSCLQGPFLQSCRSVERYEKLNRIEEGSYGIVYRAKDRDTGEIVALKKLKLENEKMGFPITALREIHTLLLSQHPHIVNVREIVVSPSLTGYQELSNFLYSYFV